MAKKMLIDATHAEETRVVVVDGTKVEEFDFETVNKRQLSGNIYLAKVTRVEPSLQAAFVDYGGNRHGFLAFAEIHPDYYQIPAADREALIAEERAYAEAQEAEESSPRGRRRKPAPRAQKAEQGDEIATQEAASADIEADADSAAEAGDNGDDQGADDAGDRPESDASDRDETIESVAEEDVTEEIRVSKKPRPRRYKIQEVIKVRQIMLVQVVKEERGNKGAALTTYLSLPGRYCVLMPNTARGGGISRKITNAADRKKLKDIAGELDVPKGAGLIIRTAGSQRTRTEIKRDYEYLLRLWEQIRDLTFKSIAPAPIYEEGDLIKRSIRDLYSKEIDEVLVEGERGYRVAKDFMKMIMPSHAKNVKHYGDQMPLFARYQVESYLGAMFNPVVQLKSGGYIVIGVTEALVAIDVNSGRATKEGSIEETALKTNLEASDEVARQLRLRDLAGLIVIDFIDMEERKNNAAVEKRLKDKLKSDRARIQVGRISGFGLMEMSRQRLRPGMLESTTQPCAHCHGTGLIRSDDSLALTILRAIEEEGTRKRSREVLVKAPVAVINFLFNTKREHIAGIEARYGLSVRLEADPALISPDYAIEKFKTATRAVPEVAQPVLSVDADLMARIDDEEEDLVEEDLEVEEERAEEPQAAAEDENGEGRGRRRRRRRRRKPGERPEAGEGEDAAADGDEVEPVAAEAAEAEPDVEAEPVVAAPEGEAEEGGKRRSRSRSRSRRKGDRAELQGEALPEVVDLRDQAGDARADALPGLNAPKPAVADSAPVEPVAEPAAEPAPQAVEETVASEAPAEAEIVAEAPVAEAPAEEAPAEEPSAPEAEPAEEPVADADADAEPAPAEDPAANVATAPEAREPELAETDADRPKRRGWWSGGR
ncbi:Rne/Rng family ribonuclease [Paracoccus siganidrum]|uniref:Ribonuclease E n=1 Tax=Paracoccus siganidrum TaxID=1276757 RepID=A0A419A5R4_9RHOB|nr:ribonuclease E/G [Paracoccus siganidrum]RJL11890.1 Rne/Rng family ribonuclease [Paracoccus siganidrum]RMC33964.1 ribonuclease E/G [Paracoccus siganidrum]